MEICYYGAMRVLPCRAPRVPPGASSSLLCCTPFGSLMAGVWGFNGAWAVNPELVYVGSYCGL